MLTMLTYLTLTLLTRMLLNFQWCSMINSFHADNVDLIDLDVTGCNFAHFYLHSVSLSVLNLSGVCTQPNHTLSLRYVVGSLLTKFLLKMVVF